MTNSFTNRTVRGAAAMLLPVLAIAVFGVPTAAFGQTASTAPALFYASAKAGPNQGWEGSTTRGAAISIWAKNAGSTRGSSYITVAGVALTSDSDYAEWGATRNPTTAKGFQRITFWLNSRMTVGNASGITLTVNGVVSNVLPFTIDNTGQIYFLSLTGSSTNNGRFSANVGSGQGPWANFGVAVTKMHPGDFLYMRSGNWTNIHSDGVQTYSYIGYFEGGTSGCVYYQPLINGTDALRITLTSYPGEMAVFEGSDVRNYSKYWTMANLKFDNVGPNQNVTLGSQWSHCVECSDHSIGLDVIGNEFAGTEHHNIQAFGDNFRIAANYVNVVAVAGGSYTADTAYSFYLSSGDNRVVTDNEIHGGAMYGIHAYDEDRESCTDVGRVLRNWTIEGNWIDATDTGAGYRSPMLIGAGNLASVDGITVKNNVLYSNGTASLTGIRIFAGVEQNINIQNNTFYGLPSGILIDYTSLNVITGITVSNNIFANLTPSTLYPGIAGNHIYNDTGRSSILTVQKNLYDIQPKMVAATDLSPIVGNPQFSNPSALDFHLTSSSPALHAGISLTGLTRDYDGYARSTTSAPDIGAFSLGSGSSTAPTPAPATITVSASPLSVTLSGGQTQQFTATVQGTTNTAVTWSVSPAVGTISAAGLYTAPSSITSAQTVTVTARSAADTTKSASVSVTLNPPAPAVSVTVTPTSASLTAGRTQQFAATVSGSTNTAVTWSLSSAVGTISSTGLYTAPSTITSLQSIQVRATSQADATKSASATVTLNPPPTSTAVSIAITPLSATMNAGQTQQFTATVSGSTNTAVTWSLGAAVGTISSSGLYTAPASVSASTTVQVRAVSQADTTKSVTATITVNPVTVSAPSPSPSSYSVSWVAVSATQLQVSWTAPSGHPSGDWLTLTGYGSPDWWYTWVQTTGTATSGTFLVTMPTTAGVWQFRMHAAGKYDVLATSKDIPVAASQFGVSSTAAASGTPMSISWTAPSGRPTGSTDFVALYPVGATNSQPIAYRYTNGATSGSFTTTAPSAGTYEVRYVMGYVAGAHGTRFTQ